VSSFLSTFFAVFTVGCALGVVLNRNAVNAAMCLLLSLIGVAALFVRLDAYLLAFLLLLVYAGAVVTLFLFIVMLLDVQGLAQPGRRGPGVAGTVIAIALLAGGIATFVLKGRLATPPPGALAAPGASLKLYASELFTVYLLPVQVVGFLLLVSMLGVIVLSKKDSAAGGRDGD